MRRYILVLLSFGSLVGIAGGQESPSRSLGKRPLIKKQGTVDCGIVEFTPIVLRDRLYRFESVHADYKKGFCPLEIRSDRPGPYFRFIDGAIGAPGILHWDGGYPFR